MANIESYVGQKIISRSNRYYTLGGSQPDEWKNWGEWHKEALSNKGVRSIPHKAKREVPVQIQSMIDESISIYERINGFAI